MQEDQTNTIQIDKVINSHSTEWALGLGNAGLMWNEKCDRIGVDNDWQSCKKSFNYEVFVVNVLNGW